MSTNLLNIKNLIFWVLTLCVLSTTTAQFGGGGGNSYSITGPSSPYDGETKLYNLNGSSVSNTTWGISSSYGSVISQSSYSANIQFSAAGSTTVDAFVQDNLGNFYFVTKSVSIQAGLSAGSITGAQTICYNGNPGNLANTASASGGPGGYAYQWQISVSGGTDWSNISGATGTSYNPPGGLTATRYYRRRVISGSLTKYTSSVKVTVKSALTAGSISGTQTVCYSGDPSTLGNSSSPANGLGGYAYQWQISTNNSSFSNINGATSSTYNPPGGQTATRWYRRRVISCSQTKYTGSVKVTVRANLSAGSIGGTQTVCYSGDPSTLGNSSSPSGGNGSYAYQWQISTNNSSFSNVSGATSSTYNPPGGQTATRWYRRRVISCSQTKYTGSVKVTVRANLNPGSITGAQTVCYNGDPGTLGNSASPSGGNGSYAYQWQISTNNSSFSNVSGATASTYNPPGGQTATRWYRRRVISCSQTKYTSSLQVTVTGLVGVPSTPSVTNNCGNTVLTRGTPPSGITWYWQSSASGTSTSNSNATLTLTNGTAHYLRGRTSNGCWGSARTINYTVNLPTTYYADTDGDGFGNSASSTSSCTPPAGYVTNDDDYNDTTTLITNVAPQTYYSDADGDGFGDGTTTISASFVPLGYAANNTDQCPNDYGTDNGCDYQPTVLSNENSVYTRVYQSAMASASGIVTNSDLIESVTYFDGLGRPKQNIAIKAGGQRTVKSVAEWTMDWTAGSGGTPFFNQNGQTAENEREIGVNPFGQQELLWKCGNDADYGADGGWNTDYFNVDKNATYRYTVWVKRTGSQNGSTYHGTQNVNNLDGSANNNPYFWSGDPPQLNQWYLLVGVVHPHDYTGGDTDVSGVYDFAGNKVLDGTEFTWRSNTTTARFRDYLYYATDINVRQFFWNPVLQKMDGNEESVTGLLAQQRLNDIVTHIGYDGYGRQEKEWLPVLGPTTSPGSYQSGDIEQLTKTYYNNHDSYGADFTGLSNDAVNAFSYKAFEASPLNRLQAQAAPGKDWKMDSGHEILFDYSTNAANEVRYYLVTTTFANNTYTPTLVADGHYPAGQLQKNVTKDENWSSGTDHTTETFTDKQGRVILKRTYNGTAHDTYYVYDNFGQLAYVLPPKVVTSDGVSATELSELCYQYVYDHRNRLVEKKVPGKEWESIVYNKLDQPIMTQDPNQAAAQEWLFTKYDAFGRVVYTGIDTDNSNGRPALQTSADSETDQFETWTSVGNIYVGDTVHYSKTAYPTSFDQVYTVNYYDSYVDTNGLSVPATVYGVAKAGDVTGLPTVNKVRVLGTDKWITTITGYDNRGRVIYTASKNDYLNTTDIVELKLDFTGRVLETTTTHTKVGNAAIVTIDSFSYDHVGRLLKHEQTLGAHTESIAENTYDELGQLVQKTVGGGLQTVDYAYNVRGWLKKINDPASLGNDLFAFGINYNTVAHSGTALFNGNIAETEWRTANTDNTLKWYRYGYDALNRITSGLASDNHYTLDLVQYDKNGNITRLKRQGHTTLNGSGLVSGYGVMDDLDYNYYPSSNQLQNVQELNGASAIYGFKNATTATTEYTYDANGNMETDTNKGITAIGYNHLNLPTTVSMNGSGGTGTISYIYDATGVKLKKTVGSSVIDYAGNYMYQNGSLHFMNHPEGYVSPNGSGGYDYVYQYKDHLGNVRLSYADNNGTAEIIEESNYYPFGLKHKGYNFGGATSLGNDLAQKWKFGGKEYQDELGLAWYDITARNYDPALGRWMNLDPLAEQMRRHSTYNYAFDNPIFFIDPDGMKPMDWVLLGNGRLVYDSRVKDQKSAVNFYGDAAKHKSPGTKLYTGDGESFVLGYGAIKRMSDGSKFKFPDQASGSNLEDTKTTSDGLLIWGGDKNGGDPAGQGIVSGNDRGSGSITVDGKDINAGFTLIDKIVSFFGGNNVIDGREVTKKDVDSDDSHLIIQYASDNKDHGQSGNGPGNNDNVIWIIGASDAENANRKADSILNNTSKKSDRVWGYGTDSVRVIKREN
ncbi:DUF6443 domain-containing protein [uncultured Croceitalea sp.]|uniref:DUF6443 domain-containing protein n=1 Tax=uncultured Croceitalea sp. TaxID=1798908 RepID=UPI00330632AD